MLVPRKVGPRGLQDALYRLCLSSLSRFSSVPSIFEGIFPFSLVWWETPHLEAASQQPEIDGGEIERAPQDVVGVQSSLGATAKLLLTSKYII